jgi:thiol-disulfide isomerase/thioredoxin
MRLVIAAVMIPIWTTAAKAQAGLKVGDPAPKLEVKEFIKGDAVARLEKGKVHVIEFWATWCPPCRAAIPHLSKLQQQHKDVIFIGVSAYEHNQKEVKPFVERMGERMDYRVALDVVPEGSEPKDGTMARTWMTAAELWFVPRAFIVNADGKIAWIGHPSKLDEPLGQIVAGKYDLKAAAAAYQTARLGESLVSVLRKARESGDPNVLLEIVDTAIGVDARLEEKLGLLKFEALAVQQAELDHAHQYGKRLVEGPLKNDASRLDRLARSIVDSDAKKANAKFVAVALQAAQRADELKQRKDPLLADTLARAYFASGDVNTAIQTQQRAIKLARGTPHEKDRGLQERLEQYKKAAN